MIVFKTPDYNSPSGGIDFIYQLAVFAKHIGLDAVVWHGLRAPDRHRTTNANVVTQEIYELKKNDILLVPEHRPADYNHLTKTANIVSLVQNHHLLLEGAARTSTPIDRLPGWPQATATIGTSERILSVLNAITPPSVTKYLIPCALNPAFTPAEKEKIVAYMPRKRAGEAASVLQLLKRMKNWKFTPIDNVSTIEAAAIVNRAAIFLSFSDKEGFGLPPAEAMAAACYVIGYNGDGGQEFMHPSYCSPIADQDVLGFAAEVQRIADIFETNPGAIAEKAHCARAYVTDKYSASRFEAAAEQVLKQISDPASPCRQIIPCRVFHYTWTKKSLPRKVNRLLRYGPAMNF